MRYTNDICRPPLKTLLTEEGKLKMVKRLMVFKPHVPEFFF